MEIKSMPIGGIVGKVLGSKALGPVLGFAGSLLGRRSDRRATAEANVINQRNIDISREREDNFIQRRVADAAKAGIHADIALGAPAIGGTASFIPSVPETGSGVGDALAEAGRTISDVRGRRDAARRASQSDRLTEARIKTEEAKADALKAEATSRTMIAHAQRGGRTNDPFTERKKVTNEQFRDGQGNVATLPVGPDVSELIGGVIANIAAKLQKPAPDGPRTGRRNARRAPNAQPAPSQPRRPAGSRTRRQ